MVRLPEHRDAYYGGAWHAPSQGGYAETINPGTGEVLAKVADCTAADVEAAITAAAAGFQIVAASAAARTCPTAAARCRRVA